MCILMWMEFSAIAYKDGWQKKYPIKMVDRLNFNLYQVICAVLESSLIVYM